MMRFVSETVENIVGKGENAGYWHFLLFPQCFQKASLLGLVKVGIVWKRVNRTKSDRPEDLFFLALRLLARTALANVFIRVDSCNFRA